MAEKTCETCRWFLPGEMQPRQKGMFAPGDGECRKNAPVGGNIVNLFGVKNSRDAAQVSAVFFPWPSVHCLDFCGEHQPTTKDTDNG